MFDLVVESFYSQVLWQAPLRTHSSQIPMLVSLCEKVTVALSGDGGDRYCGYQMYDGGTQVQRRLVLGRNNVHGILGLPGLRERGWEGTASVRYVPLRRGATIEHESKSARRHIWMWQEHLCCRWGMDCRYRKEAPIGRGERLADQSARMLLDMVQRIFPENICVEWMGFHEIFPGASPARCLSWIRM